MLENKLFEHWYIKRNLFLALILLPLSFIYYVVILFRNFLYDFLPISKNLNTFVVSIGNINVGGTGKTPFLLYLIDLLQDKYKNIVILTRGYGGQFSGEVYDMDGFSDESRLIKRRFPHITVIAGKKRYKNYLEYLKSKKQPDIVILDDGFQHRKIKRNIDIVMFDGKLLFGNGQIFPQGPLREPLGALKRADVVILKDGQTENIQKMKDLVLDKPLFNFYLDGFEMVSMNRDLIEIDKLKNKKIVSFCGIGNPESFHHIVTNLGLQVVDFIIFNDHVKYSEKELAKILKHNADYYITTEKDFVKLDKIWKKADKLLILIPKYQINTDFLEVFSEKKNRLS